MRYINRLLTYLLTYLLSKAFDKMNHYALLVELCVPHYFGFEGTYPLCPLGSPHARSPRNTQT